MATRTVIDNTDGAITTGGTDITQDEGFVSFLQRGLAGSEAIPLEQFVNGGWTAIVESGTAIVLDVNNTNQSCKGPARVRLVKGSTAGNVSVDVISRAPST